MKVSIYVPVLLAGVLFASNSQAANLYAGESMAEEVCSQCHGIKKPAEGSPFPSLAGRDVAYLRQALKDYRDKTRVSDIMNSIAGSLSDTDIKNVTAYYGKQKP
ncbi:MAG: cytochrome c [Methylococcaceae bacterium]|nr:cytochrome c [Methylococcaceae bacterium]